MAKNLYATPEMVKQFRSSRRKQNGEMPDFPETLKLMERENALSEEELPMPALDGRMEKEDFIIAYDKIPFNASWLFENDLIREKEKRSDVIFPAGRDVICVQHIHDYGYREHRFYDFYSVTYLYKGRCNFRFDDHLLELQEGDLCIIAPGFHNKVHAFPDSLAFEAMLREDTFHIAFHDFLAADSRLSDFFSMIVSGNNQNYCVLHCDPRDDDLRFFLQSFVSELVKNDSYANTLAVSLIKVFLGEAYRRYADTIEFYKSDFHRRRLDEESIYRYIRDHYINISLDQAAEYFHYNKTYLSRYIRLHFGESFMEMVTRMRIEQAQEYLRNTNKHVSDIAVLTGYETADHFSRMFRKYTGQSPATYRKKNRRSIIPAQEPAD